MKVPYVRFNEREDAILALELVAAMSGDLKENPSHWKWVVLGMQNAMQGAMVLSGFGRLRRAARKFLEAEPRVASKPERPAAKRDNG